jgi:glyoxylase-like metal-dependent hydrolase (beta-lactamase superfamily II)
MGVVQFLTLEYDEFTYGTVDTVAPLIRRVIAENPSKFTYRGTGTYIVGRGDVAVIDPGPRLDSHRDALAGALDGETVRAILVTHCHADHSPLSEWMVAETGAPTIAHGPHGSNGWDIGPDPVELEPPTRPASDDDSGEPDGSGSSTSAPTVVEESTDTDFTPTVRCDTGDVVAEGIGWRITALHTPGHTSNHTCFVLDDGDRRTIFTGDHVMGWSTTVVSPPDGDMGAYIESLRLVAGRRDDVAIPTHGPPIPDPRSYVESLVEHRLEREAQVIGGVRRGLSTVPALVLDLYADVRAELHKPAARSVLAHLVKLVDDGVVALGGDEQRARLDSTFLPT